LQWMRAPAIRFYMPPKIDGRQAAVVTLLQNRRLPQWRAVLPR